jgi:hypothetical protein
VSDFETNAPNKKYWEVSRANWSSLTFKGLKAHARQKWTSALVLITHQAIHYILFIEKFMIPVE